MKCELQQDYKISLWPSLKPVWVDFFLFLTIIFLRSRSGVGRGTLTSSWTSINTDHHIKRLYSHDTDIVSKMTQRWDELNHRRTMAHMDQSRVMCVSMFHSDTHTCRLGHVTCHVRNTRVSTVCTTCCYWSPRHSALDYLTSITHISSRHLRSANCTTQSANYIRLSGFLCCGPDGLELTTDWVRDLCRF